MEGKMVNKKFIVAGIGLALVTSLVGCSANSASTAPESENGSEVAESEVQPPEGLASDGVLTISQSAGYPPFEYKMGSELTGFDVELAEGLAEKMGLETEFFDLDWDGVMPAVLGGRADIVISGMFITPEREEQVDLIPYMQIGEVVMVPAGNPKNISEIPDDFSGKDIAVARATVAEKQMAEYNDQLISEGKEPMKLLVLATDQDALVAVESGRADAFIPAAPTAAYAMSERPGVYDIATAFKADTQIGIAVRKDGSDMNRAVNEALQSLVEDGTYEALLEKYNFPAETNIFDN